MMDKATLKRLIRADRWLEIGAAFGFTPVFHQDMPHFLDWRCVPQSVMHVLTDGKPKANYTPPRLGRPRGTPKAAHPHSVSGRLFVQQGGVCHYCRRLIEVEDWSTDHRLPKVRGGSPSSSQNKVGACRSCNGTKGFLTEEEFLSLSPGTSGICERAKGLMRKLEKHRAGPPSDPARATQPLKAAR